MISHAYANKILKALFTTDSTNNNLKVNSTIYLGLCKDEPDSVTGSVKGKGEPTIQSYDRKLVSSMFGNYTDSDGNEVTNPSDGIIKNSADIQMSTAKEDYGDVMEYWFLSASKDKATAETDGGVAYIWGKIKDIIFSTQNINGFTVDSSFNITGKTVLKQTYPVDSSLHIIENGKYIISWDNKDVDVTGATVTIKQGDNQIKYVRLGNPRITGGTDDGASFCILYRTIPNTAGDTGELVIYSIADNGKGSTAYSVGIYGAGIDVKKNTVPTFYKEELQASIDAN